MRAAVIQMVSGADVQGNLSAAARLLEQASLDGASLAVLPENFAFLGAAQGEVLAVAEPQGNGRMQDFLASQAKLLGLWIVGGSLPLQVPGDDKVHAACLVYAPTGRCVARYDKMHLFDVSMPDGKEQYLESATYLPGQALQSVDTPLGRLGLTICYDLRFPELYRSLSETGAELFSVPSAFTQTTGEAHWEILLRSRAVENLAYVLAADQGGAHPGGRQTYGGSMIVDPWGTVLARLDKGEGIACADIDLPKLRELRQRFPALHHRRFQTSLTQ